VAVALPVGHAPLRRSFWICVLLCDALILLFLPKVTLLAAACAAVALLYALRHRPEWPLAFLLLGWPLLGTTRLGPAGEFAYLYGTRILLLAGLLWAWRARPGGARGAAPAGGAGAANDGDRAARARGLLGILVSRPQSWIAAGLCLVLWAGLAVSPAPYYGSMKLKSFLLAAIVAYAAGAGLGALWARDRRQIDRFLRAALVLGGCVVLAGVLVMAGVEIPLLRGEIGPQSGPRALRMGWLGTNLIWLARVLALWIVLLFWAMRRRLVHPVWVLVGTAVGLMLMLRTGSRGPLIALMAGPAALLFLPDRAAEIAGGTASAATAAVRRTSSRLGFSRRLLGWGLAALLAAAILILLLPAETQSALLAAVARGPVGELLRGAGWGQEVLGASVGQRDPSSNFRLYLAERSLALLRAGLPWGHGTGAFPAVLFGRDMRLYPHNLFAELLFENGLPGFLLLMLFILLTYRAARRLARRWEDARWLWLLFVMALLNAQVSGDLPANEWIWLWGGVLAGWAGSVCGGPDPRAAAAPAC